MEEYVDTGRRKCAVASVRVRPGTGKIDINGREFNGYFPLEVQRQLALSPLEQAGIVGNHDLIIRVRGGGLDGQAAAVRHGLARALVRMNEGYRGDFKTAGFLTRDPRKRERKKYGRKGARKSFQFSKR